MHNGLSRLTPIIIKVRWPLIVGLHAALAALAYVMAFLIRFEFRLAAGEWEKIAQTIAFVVAVRGQGFACRVLVHGCVSGAGRSLGRHSGG